MSMSELTNPNLDFTSTGGKFIVFADYTYTALTQTHTRTLQTYSVNGDLLTDDTDETIGNITVPSWRDEWFTIGGAESNRNFTKWLTYELIFAKQGLTEPELSETITYLSNKWNV